MSGSQVEPRADAAAGPEPSLAEVRALAELRAAVYRPGATAADRAALELALQQRPAVPGAGGPGLQQAPVRAVVEHTEDRPGPTGGRIPRILGALGAVLAAATVLSIWSMGTPHPDSPAPRPSRSAFLQSGPLAFRSSVPQIWQDRVDLAALFSAADPDLQTYLLRHDLALTSQVHSEADRLRRTATGSTAVDLGSLQHGPAGRLTLLLTCDRSARYSWRMTAPGPDHDDPTTVSASGSQCAGHVIAATFAPKKGRVPTRLVLSLPAGVRSLIEVDLSRD